MWIVVLLTGVGYSAAVDYCFKAFDMLHVQRLYFTCSGCNKWLLDLQLPLSHPETVCSFSSDMNRTFASYCGYFLIFRKFSFQVCLWVKIQACQQILKCPDQTVLHQQRHHISAILMAEVRFSNLSFPGLHRSYALSICHVICTFCISKKIEQLYLMKWTNDGLGRPWKRDLWVFPFGLLQLGLHLIRGNEWIDGATFFLFPRNKIQQFLAYSGQFPIFFWFYINAECCIAQNNIWVMCCYHWSEHSKHQLINMKVPTVI